MSAVATTSPPPPSTRRTEPPGGRADVDASWWDGLWEGYQKAAVVIVDAGSFGQLSEIHALAQQYQREAQSNGEVVTQVGYGIGRFSAVLLDVGLALMGGAALAPAAVTASVTGWLATTTVGGFSLGGILDVGLGLLGLGAAGQNLGSGYRAYQSGDYTGLTQNLLGALLGAVSAYQGLAGALGGAGAGAGAAAAESEAESAVASGSAFESQVVDASPGAAEGFGPHVVDAGPESGGGLVSREVAGAGPATVAPKSIEIPAPSSGAALENGNFAQKTFSQTFSAEGKFAGRTVDEVAADLRSGALKASDILVEYIVRDGNTLILNTRSEQPLEQAGIPRTQWNAVNVTGDAADCPTLSQRTHKPRHAKGKAKQEKLRMGSKKPLYQVPMPSTDFASEATMGGGIIRFDYNREGTPFRSGIRFKRVLAACTRAERCCTSWHIECAYDTLVEVDDSPWVEEMRADIAERWRDEWETHHYLIYLDSVGCFEVIAASWEVLPEEWGSWV